MFYKELRDYLAKKMAYESAQMLSIIVNAVVMLGVTIGAIFIVCWYFGIR